MNTSPRPIRSSKTKFLTDRDKDQVDAEAKQTLRELNAVISNLQNAEELRQNTENLAIQKKYKKSGGAILYWAGGGIGPSKSIDQELDEAKTSAIATHRENVIAYLRQKLKAVVELQAGMMQKRINRELEKRKSVLANAKSRAQNAGFGGVAGPTYEEKKEEVWRPEEELTQEQIQMFEEDHQDMLRHYESTLNQVT